MSTSVWLFAGLSCIDHDDGDGLIDGEDHALVPVMFKGWDAIILIVRVPMYHIII